MPKSNQLLLSGPAQGDLEQIGQYTEREWGDAQKRKYLARISATFERLQENPSIGAGRDDIEAGLRCHPTDSHVIFFRHANGIVRIVRILHRRMDPAQHFGPPESPDHI